MVLAGAEILLYPTAIGSEPYDLTLDTHSTGSARCRATPSPMPCRSSPPTASALEDNDGVNQSYYGHSFIADHTGEIVASFGDKDEGVLVHSFDLDEIERYRAEWGFFRDRRTDLYAKSIV